MAVEFHHIQSGPPLSTLWYTSGGAEAREVENFLEEIAMMKKVSSGECCHVVQMVGCVSTALPLALALEFVPFGDLLSYLKYWRVISEVLYELIVHFVSYFITLICL